MNRIVIQNVKAVVTCDAQDRVLKDVDILIEGPEIRKIGANLDANGAEIIDGRGKFVYPGLINTHHHFFQTFVRNLMTVDYPNMSVPEWLAKIYPVFDHIDDEVIYYSSLTAFADLIKHGCTTAFDHQYCYTKLTGKKPMDRQMAAAELMGIRYHGGRGGNTLPMSKGSTMPDGMVETTEEFLEDCERLIDTYHDGGRYSMRQIVVSPCQPINSYEETFVRSAELARRKGVRLHTHLGEGENAIMLERTGMRTLAWCESIGFIGPDVWYAHGWEIQPEEYAVCAKAGSAVSHCPAPAVLGGFPILDMGAMLDAGMILSLGCDGSATNDTSSLLDSMRMAYLMQAFHSKQRGGCVAPYDILKMATVGGAKTLGRDDIGSLEAGKAADLFMVDTEGLELTGALHDPKNLLPRAGVTGPVALTMVHGKTVWDGKKFAGVDEAALAKEGDAVQKRVLRDVCSVFEDFR
ncbi:amidohydrolase [Oscillospiraceae bacterium OttesenSCG-928-F05]|nr:amidohydrolase [Oscillospiraceae bacterium OttesenSCG-928-F05]